MVDDEAVEHDALDDFCAQVGRGEAFLVARPHRGLAVLRDLRGIVEQLRVVGVIAEEALEVVAVVGVQLGLDHCLGRGLGSVACLRGLGGESEQHRSQDE